MKNYKNISINTSSLWSNSNITGKASDFIFFFVKSLLTVSLVFYVAAFYFTVLVCVCREGLEWADIDWNDNGECLDLVEKVKYDFKNLLANPKNITERCLFRKIVENYFFFRYKF